MGERPDGILGLNQYQPATGKGLPATTGHECGRTRAGTEPWGGEHSLYAVLSYLVEDARPFDMVFPTASFLEKGSCYIVHIGPTHYVALAVLELVMVLSPQPPECWDLSMGHLACPETLSSPLRSRHGESGCWEVEVPLGHEMFCHHPWYGQGRKEAGSEQPIGGGPDAAVLRRCADVRHHQLEGCWAWRGPTALTDRLLGPTAESMGSLPGSGYAKRSTKIALVVVWPKMKAPRVTKKMP